MASPTRLTDEQVKAHEAFRKELAKLYPAQDEKAPAKKSSEK